MPESERSSVDADALADAIEDALPDNETASAWAAQIRRMGFFAQQAVSAGATVEQLRAEVEQLLEALTRAHPCACEIHPSGRGLQPCMHHAQRAREHRAMYYALDRIADGRIGADDPGIYAQRVLQDVKFWHDRVKAASNPARVAEALDAVDRLLEADDG